MANSLQAKKRIRQDAVRRIRNKSTKSEIKTLTKKFLGFIEAGDRESAQELFPVLVSKMDRAGRKRIYHPNTISRQKSRLARLLSP